LSGDAFYSKLNEWRALALRGIESAEKTNCEASNHIKRVIVVGMGGSGIAGDFLADLSYYYSFPFEVLTIKEDHVPFEPNDSDLFFLISYSGKTLEALSAYREVRGRSKIVAVSSDQGFLKEVSSSGGCSLKLTEGLFPRFDLPEIIFGISALLGSMTGLRVLSKESLADSISVLSEDYSEEADHIARKMLGCVPVLIASRPYISVALRMKNDLAENSKHYSSVEALPEASHNTIESFHQLSEGLCPFLISGRLSESNIFVSSFLKAVPRSVEKIRLKGSGLLSELLYGYALSMMVSLKLSSLKGVDPYRTQLIDKYKSALKEEL